MYVVLYLTHQKTFSPKVVVLNYFCHYFLLTKNCILNEIYGVVRKFGLSAV